MASLNTGKKLTSDTNVVSEDQPTFLDDVHRTLEDAYSLVVRVSDLYNFIVGGPTQSEEVRDDVKHHTQLDATCDRMAVLRRQMVDALDQTTAIRRRLGL